MATEKLTESDEAQEAEEYVVTETPPEAESDAPEQEASAEEEADDERLADSDDDDEDDRSNGRRALTPEEKRAQRQQRKFRRKAAIEHKERELAFLRAENEEFKKRLQVVEKQTTQFNINTVDQRLNEALNEANMAERIMAKAIEQGQGEDVTKALQIRDAALERARQLKAAKEQAENSQPSKPQKDATEEYWVELDSRVARRLPHRYGEDTVEKPKAAPKRGGPPVGGKREYAAPSTRKEIYISPERKQALIDAGVWDNPDLRQKYIKRYADYDRNSSSR